MNQRALAIALLCMPATLFGQSDPSFDVVSLKRNMSLSDFGGGGPRPGGLYRLTNVPTRSMIALAWSIPDDRVLGGPGWIATDRYDVDARMKETATLDESRGMLRSLLRQRFMLSAHVEQRDLPVYRLTQVRPGALGPGLERATFDCKSLAARKEEAAAAAAARPGRVLCGFTIDTGTLDAGSTSTETLAQILTPQVGRPVLDRTGLPGTYNVHLKWTPSLGTDAPAADGVSIFTAVQEQLGLRLENGTAPLDVVVVDRIERPSEN